MCRGEGERRVGEERDTVEYCLVLCYAISHSFEHPQYKTSLAGRSLAQLFTWPTLAHTSERCDA